MKCARPKCDRARWTRRLCEVHWKMEKRAGRMGRVDAEPVRQHIAKLKARGFTERDISELSGVSYWGVHIQAQGRPKILADNAAKILAISPDARLPSRPGMTMDATGFTRRLNALALQEWPRGVLAERLGVKPQYLADAVYVGRVSRALHYAMIDLFEEIGNTPGPSPTAAGRARAAGFAPAYAWDDIDDPDEVPDTGYAPRKGNQKFDWDDVVHFRGFGYSDVKIAEKLGVSVNTIKDYERRRNAA